MISVFIAILALLMPLAVSQGGVVEVTLGKCRRICTVKANGGTESDVANILQALAECGKNGIIVFPEDQTYLIDQKIHATLHDVRIDWKGEWVVWLYYLLCFRSRN